MMKKIIAGALLRLSNHKALSSVKTASDYGYCQPKEPEAIAKLRNRNVSRNK